MKPLQAAAFTALIGVCPDLAWARIPVSVGWQVPLNPSEEYVLEVAAEPGFATLLLSRSVHGESFAWDAPAEGVYHWRLARPSQRRRGVEGSTFVSGSFVAVEGGVTRERPARVSWTPEAGADRYKLYLMSPDGRTRTMVASTTSFAVPETREALMIEVVGYRGAQRASREFHLQPGLAFDAGNPRGASGAAVAATPVAPVAPAARAGAGAAAAAAAAPRGPVVARSPGAVGAVTPRAGESEGELTEVGRGAGGAVAQAPAPTVEPTPKATPAPTVEPTPKATPAPTPTPAQEPAPAVGEAPADVEVVSVARRKRHLVYALFLHEEDLLRFQKLEVDLKSRKNVFGVGAGFWMNPVSGLVVSGHGAYHEHASVMRQEERFPGQTIVHEEARYTAIGDIGFNVLDPFVEGHALVLSLTGATTQVPTLPVQLDLATGEAPTFEKRRIDMLGGTLGYGYLAEDWAFMLEGGLTRSDTDEAQLLFGRLGVEVYPAERFAVLAGAYLRRLDLTRCHADAATCLFEGKVRTEAQEAGGYVGLGALFR